MPSSAVLRFNDPDEYDTYIAKSVGTAGMKSTVLSPGTYRMELTEINLGECQLIRGRLSLPRILHTGYPSSRTAMFFYLDDEHPPEMINGREAATSNVLITPMGADAFRRSVAKTAFCGLSIGPDKLATTAQALLGHELRIPRTVQLTHPFPLLLQRLRHLQKAACHLAETVPQVLAHPEVVKAIEQQLLCVMVGCMAGAEASYRNINNQNRTAVLRRFEDILEASSDRPLYVPEICARIGVSDRTLRKHSMEQLGVSPHRYLWLRRMNLARSALARADPKTTTVTGIAMECGFGELGRFAVAYKRLFGESPSATLAGGSRNFTSSPGNDFNRSDGAFA